MGLQDDRVPKVNSQLFSSLLQYIDPSYIQQHLKLPPKDSHKAQNGKVMVVGGSKLFHGASLWALKTASRIVDMVYYSSVQENERLATYLKQNLYAFICVPNGKETDYLEQADVVLIGPGMVRGSEEYTGTGESGEQTRELVLKYFKAFPDKTWIVDAGALQAITPEDLLPLKRVIITPHQGEFEALFPSSSSSSSWPSANIGDPSEISNDIVSNSEVMPGSPMSARSAADSRMTLERTKSLAKKYNLTIVLKGQVDIIASPDNSLLNKTGNEGMTKGGTGDVLAGLIAALATNHDPFTAAAIGAYINGLAGDELYKTVGPFFNADDLADKVPEVLWKQWVNNS